MAMKESLRSGDLYVPQSKQHVSFSHFILNEQRWAEDREAAYAEFGKPGAQRVQAHLIGGFERTIREAERRLPLDPFAAI